MLGRQFLALFSPRRPTFRLLLLCAVSILIACCVLFAFRRETVVIPTSPLDQILDKERFFVPIPKTLDVSMANVKTWQDTPPRLKAVDGKEVTPLAFNTWSGMNPALKEKLEEFAARPILEFEEAKAQNSIPCPVAFRDITTNHEEMEFKDRWENPTVWTLRKMRQEMLDFIGAQEVDITNSSAVAGRRGVVIAAGNGSTGKKALMLIRRLRYLGYSGEIEVFHFPRELSSTHEREKFEAFGATLRQVSVDRLNHGRSYNIKASAMIECSFDELLYLDGDNLPVTDVTPLFTSQLFKEPRGGRAVLWHDFNRDHPFMPVHRLLGVECYDTWQTESGQLLYAKSGNSGLNLAALHLAAYMSNSANFWFSAGDKDTFRYAFLVLDIPYTPAPRAASSLGYVRANGNFCGLTMLQYSLLPEDPSSPFHDQKTPGHELPMFMHANLMKYAEAPRGTKFFTDVKRIPPEIDTARFPTANLSQHIDAGTIAWEVGLGICVDLFTVDVDEKIIVEDANSIYGGLLSHFEEEFFAQGGERSM